MSGQRGRAAPRRSRAGWLATLVGLSLLAIPGFGLGLLGGVAWEDPGLLVSYLAGGTEEVGWASSAERPPDVAAPAPRPSASTVAPQGTAPRSATRKPAERSGAGAQRAAGERSSPRPAAGERSSSRPTAMSTPAPAEPEGHFSVQVGAFAEGRAAEDLAETLRGKGYPVYVSAGAGAGSARWRVRVGPLASREAADRTASRLKAEERLPTWVVDESRPS
ncbi:MAG: SPOR domain-containing protein [Myxococcota bacterium]